MKYSLICVDDNPSYLYLLPFIAKSWIIQGWTPYIVFNNVFETEFLIRLLLSIGVNSITEEISKISSTQNKALYTQCHRLYMMQHMPDNEYGILTDADMFIASDFLNRDYDKVNAFGYDLTGYTQVPMCYVGMTGRKWKELMNPFDVEKDLATFADKNSTDFYRAWGCDQDILTGRLRTVLGFHGVNFIPRGNDASNSGLAMGRWDRHNWIKPTGQIHDCHLSGQAWTKDGTARLIDMCETIYPEEDWSWIPKYREDFCKQFNLE